jgi:plastocyanin
MTAESLRLASLRRRRWLLAAVLALALGTALLAAACGGGSSGKAIRITPGGAGATLDITVGDNFYQPNKFRVQAGQQVTLNVTNEGVAVHTVRLAGPDNRYETDDDTMADPEMIKPGATVALAWTAPDKTGAYNFRCDYHPEETGTITVE